MNSTKPKALLNSKWNGLTHTAIFGTCWLEVNFTLFLKAVLVLLAKVFTFRIGGSIFKLRYFSVSMSVKETALTSFCVKIILGLTDCLLLEFPILLYIIIIAFCKSCSTCIEHLFWPLELILKKNTIFFGQNWKLYLLPRLSVNWQITKKDDHGSEKCSFCIITCTLVTTMLPLLVSIKHRRIEKP